MADEERSFLELLRALVETETPSGDGGRIRRAAELLERPLRDAGAEVDLLDAGELGVHLRARVPGRSGAGATAAGPGDVGPGASDPEASDPLLVLGHLDTVHPVGTLERFPFEVGEERITGPGTYDMKGPVAALVTALGRMAADGAAPRTEVVVLLTCDEEIGSHASRPHIEAEARRARGALVLEPPVAGGDCKVRRKGVGELTVRVSGVPAHAGVEPEAGASAITELCRLLPRILELADPERGTTLNPGRIAGGTAVNVVAPEASVVLDLRFREREEARRVEEGIRALETSDPRCRIGISGGPNRWPLEPTERSERLLGRAREFAREVGLGLRGSETGGASDGNLTAAAGCPTLDGFGIEGSGAHTLEEGILRADVPRRIALYRLLLEGL